MLHRFIDIFVDFIGTDPFGAATIKRSWDDDTNSVENAKRRLRAAFEFFSKLGKVSLYPIVSYIIEQLKRETVGMILTPFIKGASI